MDLGEFARLRNPMLVAIVVGAFLAWKYVEEFLAVRAMGMLGLACRRTSSRGGFHAP